jgi:tape measure domain-containing protein
MATDLEQLTLRIEANTRGVDRALKTLNRNLDSQFKAMENRASSFEKHLSSLGRSAIGVFATLGAGFGAAQLAQGLAGTALQMDRVNKALTVVAGSSSGARDEFEFIRSTANALGLELMSTAQQYAFLAAAAKGTTLEGQAVRDIFTAVSTAASSLGLSADSTAGALNAIQQMISKGTVSAEELRGQLGERLPGAFQAAARAMGMTTQELGKQLELGNILAADMLPRLAEELMKMGDQAGKGTQADLNRLKNAWTELQAAFLETSAVDVGVGVLQGLANMAKDATSAVRGLTASWSDYQAAQRQAVYQSHIGAPGPNGQRVGTASAMEDGMLSRRMRTALSSGRDSVTDFLSSLATPDLTTNDVAENGPGAAVVLANRRRAATASSRAGSSAEKSAARDAERDAKQYAEAVSELQFNLSLLAMTTDAASYAQQLHSNLQRAGVEIDSARGEQIAQLTAQTWDQEQAIMAAAQAQEHAAERAQMLGEMWGELGNMATGALEDIILRGEDAGETIGRFLLKIAEMIALQSISGTGPFASVFGDIFGRAGGGRVNRGQPYLVGEQGPELMIPSSAGRIAPRGQFGGGGTVINLSSTINAPGANPSTLALMQQMLDSRDQRLRRDLPSIMADKQRRNSLGGAFG